MKCLSLVSFLVCLVVFESHVCGALGGADVRVFSRFEEAHGRGHSRGHRRGNSHGHAKVHVKGLTLGFYKDSCPEAEELVKNITWSKIEDGSSLPAKLIRLQFHDCFVKGCDASVLLDPVAGKDQTEKQARPNLSLGGFEVIDEIKTKLEQVCPQKVSCADIIALSARDAVSFQYKRDLWAVPTGRRDGVVSLASEANKDVPSPFANFTSLKQSFASKKLGVLDLVALSGAHTIGVSHCGAFSRRLQDADSTLNAAYAAELRLKCPNPPADPTTTVEMDPHDSGSFNNHYYQILTEKKGLFLSDAALLTDPEARAAVEKMKRHPSVFLQEFAKSMVKMGAIDVLTGDAGQIRKKCNVIN